MAGDKKYTYDDELEFIKNLYCPARQVADETGCSWKLILAQAAQETGWGEHVLEGTNNFFNIKADASWHGESRNFTVPEEREDGSKYWVTAPFRVYPSMLESLRDRQKFLASNPRYAAAGLYSEGVKGNLEAEARALQSAGYATDKKYAKNIIEVAGGKSMKRAIERAQKAGCKGCLPTVNVYVLDQAKAHLVDTKIRATQGGKTIDLVTDKNGQVQVQAALSGGPVSLQAWSEHDHKWVQIEQTVTPTTPATAITVVAPTIVVPSATELHKQPLAPAPTEPRPATSHPAAPTETPAPAAAAAPAPAAAASHASVAGAAPHGCTETYIVQKGDTLSKIAKKYSTSYRVLARLNGIASPYFLYPHQVLTVPKAHAHPSSSSGAATAAAPVAAGSSSAVAPVATGAPVAVAAPATSASTAASSHAAETHGKAVHTAPAAPATSAPAHPSTHPASGTAGSSPAPKPAPEVHAVRSRDESDHPKTEALSASHAPWMTYAEEERRVGIKRKGGDVSTEHIKEYFGATSQTKADPNSAAYCAAFVNWCLQRAGYEGTKGKTNAMASSFLKWGKPTKGNKPVYGAIAVVRFGKSAYHVTFVNGAHRFDAHQHLQSLATLGGNQGKAHEVNKSHLPPSLVVAYRLPIGYDATDDDYQLALVPDDGSTSMTAASTR
ncbi:MULTISPECIES: TIGR02594 family protein [Burkholderia]|uniref:TIGR02594 family protein n=1 Tax=Burkholderia TaxID=32008 RepID=UPI00064F2346|nr:MULTISPECIES: TIGR02594 family protein [Burkholderia]KML22298.1 flagellar rod assembly protein FlgJ [Burkholderia cepacia]KMN59425.1 flagellar rod assembly protein FlgJ [Burkholderia sp. LK4]